MEGPGLALRARVVDGRYSIRAVVVDGGGAELTPAEARAEYGDGLRVRWTEEPDGCEPRGIGADDGRVGEGGWALSVDPANTTMTAELVVDEEA